ncbi:MAG TPA: class I adenylate-forming enzyme family protein [Chthoniobacterales bacterium]|nr:class I adenylate-forming enzyme family protein [Chthoniobacterales bacterium]
MNPVDPLLAAWHKTLARRRAEGAIFDTHRRVLFRFGEIEELSRHYEEENGCGLAEFEQGEIIALQIGNHAHWPALFLAALRREIVVLPIEQTVSERERASASKTCRAAGLMTSPGKEITRLGPGEPVDWGDRRPVLLKLTSGTTAAPRAIRFRSAQLLADAEQICDTMGITDADLNFAVIPLSHSYGFSNLVTPLLVRGVPMAVSGDRIPRAVLDGLARTEATVFPGMPVFYQAFTEMASVPPLPILRLCISAGAPLGGAVARRFQEKFGLPIHSFYGASECGGICYDGTATNEEEGFVGPAMQGVELQPLDSTAKATQVRVRSAAVADAYYPEPEPAKLGNGFFVPDDLLTISTAGARIVGRLSDVINVAGKKVNPAEVEAHLLNFEGVRQAVVFGRASTVRNEEVVACVVAEEETDEATLLEFCRARLSGWQVPKRIFFLEALPANERGKVSRRELAARFAA